MGVDIETYSSVDLVKTGTRPYTEAPDFAILLISYKVDDQPTRIIDLTGGAGADHHALAGGNRGPPGWGPGRVFVSAL